MLRLVKIGVEGEGSCTDVMQVNRPEDLHDIADLGLTLAEAKRLLARVQQEIVAAQARDHAVQRLQSPHCGHACRVKDYTGTMRSRRSSARLRCGFPGFAVPRVTGSKLAWTGHRIAGRHPSWTGCRRIFVP